MKTIFTSFRLHLFLVLLLVFIAPKAGAVAIISITPEIGVPGTLVTITGTDLNNPTAFTIGGKPAIIISNTGTQLVGMVMPGAKSGNVSITNANGTAYSPKNFLVIVAPIAGANQNIKLLANDNIGPAAQGSDIAISADRKTAIVGGYKDNNSIGAAWIYTKNGNWQQSTKLIGTGAIGQSQQGVSVSLSADAKTAIVGGPGDNAKQGAVWVFTCADSVHWVQQAKLTATETTGSMPALFGASVSLSADGNTMVAEARGDNDNVGAAYVFTRNANTWTQVGHKLIATGSVAGTNADQCVALSADGKTFVMGAHTATPGMGSAWVFTRYNGTWEQQGSPLFGTGAIGQPNQGSSVAVSADGNTIAVGGYTDNAKQGAVWIFTRTAGTWAQQGSKLISSNVTGNAAQGSSVRLSADGNVLITGGIEDNNFTGAAWVYSRTDTTWTERGKMTGLTASNNSNFGNAMALSADGITAIVGSFGDNNSQGAAWVCDGLPSNPQKPIVKTLPATAISKSGGTLNGTVDATGAVITTVVFEYSTTPDVSYGIIPALNTGLNPLPANTPTTSYSSILTGLLPSTTYYYKIVAANFCTGITEGQILSFTTDGDPDVPAIPGSGQTLATIPTAFTPNNDGVNDKWEIPFLNSYPNCSVKIFNRSGQIVFTSTGYSTSWDGRYKNTELPTGAYFYVIDLKNNQNKISGSVNLIK